MEKTEELVYKDEGYQPSLAFNEVLLLLITHVPNGCWNPEFTRERKPAREDGKMCSEIEIKDTSPIRLRPAVPFVQ